MKEKLSDALKAKRKLLLCIALVIVVLLLLLILVPWGVSSVRCAIKSENARQKILEKYDGGYYTYIPEEEDFREFYAFKDGQLAIERISSTDGSEGDITAFSSYNVKASLENDYVSIEQNGSPVMSFYLMEDEVHFDNDSIYATTPENIENVRRVMLCEHDWEETVYCVATCTRDGRAKKECKICGESEVVVTEAGHHYVNDRCNRCGEYSSESGKTNMTVDTWYTYEPFPLLKVKNISVTSAIITGQGKHLTVTGYRLCASCHTFEDYLHSYVIAYRDSKYETYRCEKCGYHNTLVRYHLDD